MHNRNGVYRTFVCFVIGGLMGCLFFNILWKFAPFLNISERRLAMSLLTEDDTYKLFWKTGIGIMGMCIYIFTIFSAFTDLGLVISQGFCLIIGIWWGSFITECILVRGIRFLFELSTLLFPECMLFLIAYLCCMMWVEHMSVYPYKGRKYSRKKIDKHWKTLIISFFFFSLWCLKMFYVHWK